MVLFFGLIFLSTPLENFLPTPLAVCFRISRWSRSKAHEGGKVGAYTSGRGPWRRINTLYSDI